MGAWIEILIGDIVRDLLGVAPLVGAWIEICQSCRQRMSSASLLSWERGLKCYGHSEELNQEQVAPLVGAWIEIAIQSLVFVCL